jgi:hypothetical protein
MARVSHILNAGLASQALPPPPEETRVELVDESRYKARERIDRETSGLPNEIVPAALAGAGAGWVFGPLGGLIGFAVAGHFAKKQREQAEAYAESALASERDHVKEARDALDNAASLATTEEELANINLRREEVDGYAAALNDPDPGVRRNALIGLQGTAGTLAKDIDDWEGEALERQKEDRAATEARLTRLDGIYSDYVRDSAEFDVQRRNYEGMRAVEDTAWGDQVLMVRAFKVIDPRSAVLPGEAATAANAAGVPPWALTAYNRLLRNGGRLDPDERADLLRQTGLQYGSAYAAQQERRSNALGRARANGITDEAELATVHSAVRIPTTDVLPFGTAKSTATETAADLGLEFERDEYGVLRAYEPGFKGQPGYEVKDVTAGIQQDAAGESGLEASKRAGANDLDPVTGEPLGFFEALVTPGAINDRNARLKRQRRKNTR